MDVFISWSGDYSKECAEILADWIPNVLQNVRPFFSHNDIEKGEYWTARLNDELGKNTIGLLCITGENQSNPWLLFEAGAIAKGIGKNKVIPVLFDIATKDLHSPLNLFNATSFTKTDIYKLIKTLNRELETLALDESRLEKIFETFWSDVDSRILKVLEKFKDGNPNIQKTYDPETIITDIQVKQNEIYKFLSNQKNIDYSYEFQQLRSSLSNISLSLETITNIENANWALLIPQNKPSLMNCDIIRFKHDNKNWISFIGLDPEEEPIIIFTINDYEDIIIIPKSIVRGTLRFIYEQNSLIRYEFNYTDKFSYKNTVGMSPSGFNKSFIYTDLINFLLYSGFSSSIITKVLNDIINLDTKQKAWCTSVSVSLKKYSYFSKKAVRLL